jgi:hypothetical protein
MGAEIFISAIMTGVLIFAWDHPVPMPPLWHDIYLALVKSMNFLPLVSLLALFFWIYRANKNARALSERALEYSPGWAIGWFFVPLAGWWQPYKVMREIYKVSRTPHDWRKAGNASIVGLWWTLRLISTIGSIAVMTSHPTGQLLIRVSLVLAAAVCSNLLLLTIIVARINTWQAKARRSEGVEAVF